MSTTWKQSVTLFLNQGDSKKLKSDLRRDWIDIFPEDKMEIYRFLFHAHQDPIFVSLFLTDLQSQAIDLPWLLFVKLLERHQVKIPDEHFAELVKKLRRQQIINEKVKTFPELCQELMDKRNYQFMQNVQRQKQELLASARIAESEQLVDQQVFYLNELKKISPKDFNVSSLIWDRQKQNASRILERRNRSHSLEESDTSASFDDEQLALLERLKSQADAMLERDRSLSSDFAYMFRGLGDFKNAVDFVYLNEDIDQKDWQLLDFLFSGKQYLGLLDHCSYLKSKYSGEPDFLFSVSYAEAIAYWQLGEKSKAMDLMEQITSMRPDFKTASETLARWKEDYFE